MPLVLFNTRNHCYSNAAVQLLYNIKKIRFFFQQEKFRINGSQLSMPICNALSVIFKTDGRVPTSTEDLRNKVAIKSGNNSFSNGSMEDSLNFLDTLLKMLKKEIPPDNCEAQKILNEFEGEEMVERKFMNTSQEGKCQNCQSKPDVSRDKFCWLIPKMTHEQTTVKLSELMESYFDGDAAEMKCSVCCQHPSNCPLTGLCKMKLICSFKRLSNIPNQLLIQLNRFDGKNAKRIKTVVEPDQILELPAEENGKIVFVQYKLSAVIDHIGETTNAGHYIAFVEENERWVKCNDNHISESSEGQFKDK